MWKILSSELTILFDDNLKTTAVSFFIADFNLLNSELDSFIFKLLYCLISYWQKTSYSITDLQTLTSSNFSYMFYNHYLLVKKVAINFWHCSLSFLLLEDNFLNVMFYHLYFQQAIQKINLFLENIDKLRDSKIPLFLRVWGPLFMKVRIQAQVCFITYSINMEGTARKKEYFTVWTKLSYHLKVPFFLKTYLLKLDGHFTV